MFLLVLFGAKQSMLCCFCAAVLKDHLANKSCGHHCFLIMYLYYFPYSYSHADNHVLFAVYPKCSNFCCCQKPDVLLKDLQMLQFITFLIIWTYWVSSKSGDAAFSFYASSCRILPDTELCFAAEELKKNSNQKLCL